MSTKKKGGYIEKFLKKADQAIQDGVKRADEVLEDAVEFGTMTAAQAKKTAEQLRKEAKKERTKLTEKGIEKLNESITAAKQATTSADKDLETLEKLGKLRKTGILTEKEFQEKKKKILSRI